MIELKDLNKSFKTAAGTVDAVRDVNLTISDGDIYGIIGFSGAGKSTLVRCINLLERPTSGQVIIDGTDLCSLNRKQLRGERRSIGMIFQQFNLLSQRTVEANVRYPLEIAGASKEEAAKRAAELLTMVDLADKARAYPAQLSGGQKQRVAIARALASNPRIILCDEATSALDPITTRSILDLLKRLNEQLGVTIVVITHEMKVVEQICDHVAVMANGRIVEQGNVRDVFLKPASETAKRLIDPGESELSVYNTPNTLRLAFTGEESGAPVISDMTVKCDVMVSILAANTENIGGKAFGQMLIQLPEDAAAQKRICDYLDARGIFYETADAPASGGAEAADGADATADVEARQNAEDADAARESLEETEKIEGSVL